MNVTASIPATVSPEAAAAIAELGMQTELQRMIDHALQTIPGLERIDVALEPHYDTGDETKVLLHALRDPATLSPDDQVSKQWTEWVVRSFSSEVLWHTCLIFSYGKNHAR